MQHVFSRPRSIVQNIPWGRDLGCVVLGSLLFALLAPLSIRLPFTLVPITTAPHIALLLGAILGKARGSFAVLGYLVQGMIGLPVFACGASGIFCLTGPTGGYLIGYIVAAYLVGYLIEKMPSTNMYLFLALGAGNLVILLLGVMQLALFTGISSALVYGIVPFLALDAIKIIIVTKVIGRFVR